MELLITNAIGDFLAFESHWSDEFLAGVETIHWANRGEATLIPVLKALPEFAHVEHRRVAAGHPGFIDAGHLRAWQQARGLEQFHRQGVQEWGWTRLYEVPDRKHKFRGSRLLEHSLADVSDFELPAKFVVVQVDSGDNTPSFRQSDRALGWPGIKAVARRLQAAGLTGVVLDSVRDYGPTEEQLLKQDCFLDLRGKTSFGQAVELLKRAEGYWGIDSCFAVLAAQLWAQQPEKLRVVCKNRTVWDGLWRAYYAPQRQWQPFLTRSF